MAWNRRGKDHDRSAGSATRWIESCFFENLCRPFRHGEVRYIFTSSYSRQRCGGQARRPPSAAPVTDAEARDQRPWLEGHRRERAGHDAGWRQSTHHHIIHRVAIRYRVRRGRPIGAFAFCSPRKPRRHPDESLNLRATFTTQPGRSCRRRIATRKRGCCTCLGMLARPSGEARRSRFSTLSSPEFRSPLRSSSSKSMSQRAGLGCGSERKNERGAPSEPVARPEARRATPLAATLTEPRRWGPCFGVEKRGGAPWCR